MSAFLRYPATLFIGILSMLCFLLTCCVEADKMCCFDGDNVAPGGLVGTWRLVEQKVGIGPPGEWEDVGDGPIFEFRTDQSFTSSSIPECTTGSFEVNRDTLILRFDCVEVDKIWDFIIVEFKQSSMTLTPASVFCTEGCIYRYEKIQ